MKIGIDLGGTKIEGILLDGEKQISRLRIPTPRGNYEQILDAIASVINSLESNTSGFCTVGIGTPGSLNPQGFLRNSNTTELNHKPFLKDLEIHCKRSIRISNDANCFALSEALNGAAKNFNTVFGIILGTGVGGALIINKEILVGRNHIGGEWGHNPLPWMKDEELQQDRACYCGKHQCIETFLSGPGLSQSYYLNTNNNKSAEEIAKLSQLKNQEAEQVFDQYEDQLARALATVINIFDPECIVLGGGLSKVNRLYENIPKIWGNYIFSDSVKTVLLPPEGGDSAGVKGAAWLWY